MQQIIERLIFILVFLLILALGSIIIIASIIQYEKMEDYCISKGGRAEKLTNSCFILNKDKDIFESYQVIQIKDGFILVKR